MQQLWHLVGENQVIPWQGVYFFNNDVLQKNLETLCSDGKHDKHHW